MLTHPPRLLLRILLLANAAMTCTVVMTTLGTKTSVGTTQEALDDNVLRLAPEHKPCVLPERFVNELSGETSRHQQIPLFDARLLHSLDISASNFRAEANFYLDAFLKHRWYSGNIKQDKSSLLQVWKDFILSTPAATSFCLA